MQMKQFRLGLKLFYVFLFPFEFYIFLGRARTAQPELELVVEADRLEQALEAAQAGADRVLLDNFTVEEALAAAKALRPLGVAIELSGGLTLENIADYAPHGDCLSLGVLTLGAPPVNFGLHVD